MMSRIDAYGQRLAQALPARRVPTVRILGEAAEHLLEAADRYRRTIGTLVSALAAHNLRTTRVIASGLPGCVRVIAGRAEHLPLCSGCVDVAWLSAVVHHLVDLETCAHELRRVVIDDGVVLIRGLLADGPTPPGIQFFPGWERAVAVFPTDAPLTAAFAQAGFNRLGRVDVRDHRPSNVGQAPDRVRRLRHADSLLARLTDEQVAAGLAAIDARDPTELIDPASLTLLAFATADGSQHL